MNALSGKIYSLLTAADNINQGAPPPQSRWICLASPGLTMSRPQLKFGNLRTADEMAANSEFSALVNSIPSALGSWAPTVNKVWDVYSQAITQIDLPSGELSEQEKGQLDKAEKFLMTTTSEKNPFDDTVPAKVTSGPSSYVKAYDTYEAKYSQLLMDFNAMVIEANKPGASDEALQRYSMNGPIRRRQVEQAFAAWTGEGYKEWTEQARGIISNLTGKAPQALYNRLKANYDMAQRLNQRTEIFYPTFCYPDDILNSQYDGSWTDFEFSKATDKGSSQSRQISYGAEVSASWGLWSASGSVGGTTKTERSQSDTTGLTVSAKLLQVPIQRSWLNATIFGNRNWKWSKSGSGEDISKSGSPPSGKMPLIPVSMILAKNVSIKMDMESKTNKSAMSEISTKASGGWGPFRVAGNYSQKDESKEHDATVSAAGLSVAGAQIIGMICTIVPAPSPNPNPALNWK